MRLHPCVPILLLQLVAAMPAAAAQLGAPRLVSPGGPREARTASGCPTFSWTLVEGATGYVLVVHDARPDEGASPEPAPLLRAEIPAGATTWTPSWEECLRVPGRYGWAVGARGQENEIRWSSPAVFRVLEILPERSPAPRTPDSPHSAGVSALAAATPAAGPEGATSPSHRSPNRLAAEAFAPPACDGGVFTDVTAGHAQCAWIELLAADQIAGECAAGRYCPDNPVTRGQIAVLLERVMRGTDRWRPELGDGAAANLTPAPLGITPLDSGGGLIRLYTSITLGADGLALIAFASTDGVTAALNVAHCSNIACSEATITPIDAGGQVGVSPSVAIGSDGLGLISYYDVTNGDLKVAHCVNVACTAASVLPTALDTDGDVGVYSSLTIGADGLGLISYYDVTNGDLKVAHCANPACTSANLVTLDDPNAEAVLVGEFTSITTGADGLGLISYHDTSTDDLKVAHCSNLLCSSATITMLEDPAAPALAAGQYTSITVGADGLGIVSYYDATFADLKVAHCSNLLCSAATFATLDEPGAEVIQAGRHTSITVGADGLPFVSYSQSTDGDLRVAHCADVTCSAATVVALDTAGNVGDHTAVTIGADGLPLVSYVRSDTGDLKVAHCPNLLCRPFFRRR